MPSYIANPLLLALLEIDGKINGSSANQRYVSEAIDALVAGFGIFQITTFGELFSGPLPSNAICRMLDEVYGPLMPKESQVARARKLIEEMRTIALDETPVETLRLWLDRLCIIHTAVLEAVSLSARGYNLI